MSTHAFEQCPSELEAHAGVECRFAEQTTLAIRMSLRRDELGTGMVAALEDLLHARAVVPLGHAGEPYLALHQAHDDIVDVEIGIPVDTCFSAQGRARRGAIPAGRYVTYELSYETGALDVAHAARVLAGWLRAHHERASGPLYLHFVEAVEAGMAGRLRIQRKIAAGCGSAPTSMLVRDVSVVQCALASLTHAWPRTRLPERPNDVGAVFAPAHGVLDTHGRDY